MSTRLSLVNIRNTLFSLASVLFPPIITTQPVSVISHRGDNVTFHCEAEANPEPVYLWTRDKSGSLEAVTQNLTLIASEATERTYLCNVFSDGHQLIRSELQLKHIFHLFNL